MKALAIVVALAGCAAEEPDDWPYVYSTIIAPQCTTSACHSALSRAGDIDMRDAETACRTLTDRGFVDGKDSYLLAVIEREGPKGMPPNGKLAKTEIDRIRAWIARGAPCE